MSEQTHSTTLYQIAFGSWFHKNMIQLTRRKFRPCVKTKHSLSISSDGFSGENTTDSLYNPAFALHSVHQIKYLKCILFPLKCKQFRNKLLTQKEKVRFLTNKAEPQETPQLDILYKNVF